MKRRVLPALLLLLVFLCGCGAEENYEEETPWYAEEEQEAEPGLPQLLPDRFSLAIHRSQTLDGVDCSEGTQQYVGSLLYEPLFELDEQFAPQKVLCEDYTVSEDGKVWQFRLREDVTFGDGSPLRAADVVAVLRRAVLSARYATRLADIASVTATRDGTVQITLWQPNMGLPALLNIPIVKAGTEYDPVPAGTGPYLFITDGEGAYLSARSDWWQGKKLPLQRIELVDAKDTATVQYHFTSREVQLYGTRMTTATSALVGSLDCVDAPTAILHYLILNTRHELLADGAVRRCISAGIDRETITTGYFSGHARGTQFPIVPESALYPTASEQPYSYESYAAAAESAGLRTGEERELRLLVNAESDEKTAIARYIADALSAFDLEVAVAALPWQEYLAALEAGEYDICCGEIKLSADFDVSPLLATGGTLNYGGWADPRTDELLTAYRTSADREEAAAAFYAHFAGEMPIVPICFENLSVLTHRDTVAGAVPTADNVFYNFADWTVRLAR